MPRNLFQRMIFALITVFITVHAFVFYSVYCVNGNSLIGLYSELGFTSVLEVIKHQKGIYMFGTMIPVWGVILIELIFAFVLEICFAGPLSFKLAVRVFNPAETNPVLFESTIINTTVCIMCPLMSLIAAIAYYPYYNGFNILTVLASWFKLLCFNFPFAFFSQMYFIQPLVRCIFRFIFAKDIASRKN